MRREIYNVIHTSGLLSKSQIIESLRESMRVELINIHDNERMINKCRYQIYLDRMNINDDEIEEIANEIVQQKPLTSSISLDGNNLSDVGVEKLCLILSQLKQLLSLSLQSNRFGERGFVAVFKLFAKNQNLDLALAGNLITEVGKVEKLKISAINSILSQKTNLEFD